MPALLFNSFFMYKSRVDIYANKEQMWHINEQIGIKQRRTRYFITEYKGFYWSVLRQYVVKHNGRRTKKTEKTYICIRFAQALLGMQCQ